MGLNAKNIKGNAPDRVEQAPLAIGVYPGRLVQVIDLGLQPQRAFKGQDKAPAQEIMLTYELVDEFMKDKDGNDVEDKPRWISETLPFYGLFADKAKSTQRYNALDPSGDLDGAFDRAIGFPVNVTVVQNASGDKVYSNVGNIATMRPRDAEKCAALKNPAKVFDLDAPDMEVFNALPKWIQEKIQANLNYEGSVLQKAIGKVLTKKQEKEIPKEDVPDAGDDNNPY